MTQPDDGVDVSGDALAVALRRDEFVMHYQPTVDLRDGLVIGVEALIRWRHPRAGLLEPARFIAASEETGQVVELGDWVVDQVCAQIASWSSSGLRVPRVWFNLATAQLARSVRIDHVVVAAMERHSVDPGRLGVEVTESGVMHDIDDAVVALRAIRTTGIEIALDDFGTGYSSLTYLRRLPVDVVKIDRSFVSGLGVSLADASIVEAVVELSHALGLSVLAEGIEQRTQLDALASYGVDRGQGWYFSESLPPESIGEVLHRRWCGARGPSENATIDDSLHRGDPLPGSGSPRARLLLTALDSVSDAVAVFESRRGGLGPLAYVNPAFEEQTGRTWSELAGSEISLLFGVDGVLPANLRRAALVGKAAMDEVSITRADETVWPVEMTLSPMRNRADVITHWLAVGRDLTIRRQLEAERSRLRVALERGSTGVVLADERGILLYANQAMSNLVGRPVENLVGVAMSSVLERAVVVVDTAEIDRADVIGDDGGRIAVSCLYQYFTDDMGVPCLAVMIRDIRPELLRNEMQQLSGEFAERALSLDPGVPLHEVGFLGDLVERVGRLLDSDFCHLDLIDRRDAIFRPVATWQRSAGLDRLQPPVPLAALPLWVDAIEHSSTIVFTGHEHNQPLWQAERAAAFGAPHAAAIAASLRVRGSTLGVLGVSNERSARLWTTDEIGFMRVLADTIANLLDRHLTLTRRRAYDALAYRVARSAAQLGPTEFLERLDHILAAVAQECGWSRPNSPLVVGAAGGDPILWLRSHAGADAWGDDESALLASIGDTVAIARERSGVEQSIRRRTRFESVVAQAARTALEHGPVALLDLAPELLRETTTSLGADCAWLDVVDQRAGVLRKHVGWSNEGPGDLTDVVPIPLDGHDTWLEVLKIGDPVVIADLRLEHSFRDHVAGGFPFRAVVAIPLMTIGADSTRRLVGVLGSSTLTETRDFVDDDVRALRHLADILSWALSTERGAESIERGPAGG